MKRLFIAGHNGLVGRALLRALAHRPEWDILTRTRQELDLRDRDAVHRFFREEKPDQVILAAAKVGGIQANRLHPVDYLLENLQIQNNVIEAAHLHHTAKLLFLGSTCIYPKAAPLPIREDSLLTGPMEPTNEPYSVAKIAGIKLCQAYRRQYGRDFIVAMPANLYGPHDNFDPEHSHVLPALIRKFHEARIRQQPTVTLWGTGNPCREFMHADDLASACLFLLEHYSGEEIVNVGTGRDMPIREAAEAVRTVTGFAGDIVWDTSKPDGNPRRLLDVSRLTALGWKARKDFHTGLRETYEWFLQHVATPATR
jgi:GDP-L-fucose synthase